MFEIEIFLSSKTVIFVYRKLMILGTWTQIQRILILKTNIEVDSSRLRPNDVMLIQGDNTKLVNKLSWQPTY